MTRAQALAMNKKFVDMDSTIKDYSKAYKFKYFQLNQARQTMMFQDSVISAMENKLKLKPIYKPMTKTDIIMTFLISIYGTLLIIQPF
jgi:hypothetical protein